LVALCSLLESEIEEECSTDKWALENLEYNMKEYFEFKDKWRDVLKKCIPIIIINKPNAWIIESFDLCVSW